MINFDDLRKLRYFIAYCIVVLGFFVYSGLTGWRWFNPTKTEPTRSTTGHHSGARYLYHK